MSNPVSRVLGRKQGSDAETIAKLRRDVDQLQAAVEESRRLNERLSDVLDVVVELLVPAVDRDEDRLAEALKRL
jgi:hypothetical protein